MIKIKINLIVLKINKQTVRANSSKKEGFDRNFSLRNEKKLFGVKMYILDLNRKALNS